MKHRLIETGYDILMILMNHLLIIAFGMILMGLLKQEDHEMWLWTVLAVLPIFLYWVRCTINNFFLFFIVHLLLPGLVLLVPVGIIIKVIMMIITVVYVVWSISIRIKSDKNREELIGAVFVFVALTLITLIENLYCKKGWESKYLLLAILYATGYFLYYFIGQYLRFLRVNESSASNIPQKEIFYSGIKQIITFMSVGVVALFLTANISWLSYVLSVVGKVLLTIMRALFSGNSSEAPQEEVIEEIVKDNTDPDMSMLGEYVPPHWIWEILEKIAMIAVYVILAGLLVFAIVKGVRYIWNQFRISVKPEEKKLQSGIDIRESCVIEKSRKEERHWFAFLDNREKVRKIFKKKILKHRMDIIGNLDQENLQYLTAKECCDKLVTDMQMQTSSGIMKEIYEKARYSKEDINAEDMKAIRSAGK